MATTAQSLKNAAIRLLRERWPNPDVLAEELFAILSSLADEVATEASDSKRLATMESGATPSSTTGSGGSVADSTGGTGATGAQGPEGPPGPPGSDAPALALQLRIIAIFDNHLSCANSDSDTILVVRPFRLRRLAYEGISGYAYVNSQQRTYTTGSITETHSITPSYSINDYIYAGKLASSITIGSTSFDYVDLNTDARTWARTGLAAV
jgi:hypothetical protein